MSDIEFNKGTEEERPSTALCSTCKRYVTKAECGRSLESVKMFTVVMAAFPCRFPEGRPA